MNRRRSLTTRLTLSHLLATFAGLVLLGGTLLVLVARSQQTATLASLRSQASVFAIYAATLAGDTATLEGQAQAVVTRFPTLPDVTVRIFAPNGSPLLQRSPLGIFPSTAVQPFLAPGLIPPLVGESRLRRYVATPITVNDQTIGVVEVSQSTARERSFAHTLLLALLLAGAVALLGASLLANFLARSLTRPLHRLGHVAGAIAAGDLAVRSPDHSRDEIGQLAAEINTMAADLEARIAQVETLAASRQQFYRSVSHELRTPLTAIRGMAENLEDDVGPAQLPALQVIQAETVRLQRLVEELLQPGDQLLTPLRQRRVINLPALVAECAALLAPRAVRGGIDLRTAVTTPATVIGDRDRLKQALLNLLDNALKWTPVGGQIRISQHTSARSIQLIVQDSGPGIPAALRPTVWERGVHSADGGQGFGLALVREVIEAHGGAVYLLDRPGTAIAVELPANPHPTPAT